MSNPLLICMPFSTDEPLPQCSSQATIRVLANQFCQLQSSRVQHPSVVAPALQDLLLSTPISTPLRVEAWQAALASHPHRDWVESLLNGMRSGFRLGLRSNVRYQSSKRNHPSALTQPQVISSYLQRQVEAGYTIGPLDPKACSGVVVSSLGVVPKSTPGKFRVIVDLSRPPNLSVNDNLHREWTHTSYSSVDDAALLMHALGTGTLMAKLDIREAYRIIPIHPEERCFLGVLWDNKLYIDCQLPFGLASAPAIFSALAEALHWVLHQRGVRALVHYLDDFLLLGAPGSSECSVALATTLATCQELGVPIASNKVEGPAVSLTFLGIHLHSSPLMVSLPQSKQLALQASLGNLLNAKCIRDSSTLDSLVGHLIHATKVCPLGKAFLSGFFHALRGTSPGRTWRLNKVIRSDIAWWYYLLRSWSGVSTHQFLCLGHPEIHLFTDASGSWGCGAFVSPRWIQVEWPSGTKLNSIALKELVPIVLAAAVWGPQWAGKSVLCHSDNSAVVSQVNSIHARDPKACDMLRCLAFFQAQFDFHLRATHIAGAKNVGADHLSRGRTHAFLKQFPSSLPSATQVPRPLIHLLCLEPSDWTSLSWRLRFNNFWRQASQIQPEGCTAAGGQDTWPLLKPSPYPQRP